MKLKIILIIADIQSCVDLYLIEARLHFLLGHVKLLGGQCHVLLALVVLGKHLLLGLAQLFEHGAGQAVAVADYIWLMAL